MGLPDGLFETGGKPEQYMSYKDSKILNCSSDDKLGLLNVQYLHLLLSLHDLQTFDESNIYGKT